MTVILSSKASKQLEELLKSFCSNTQNNSKWVSLVNPVPRLSKMCCDSSLRIADLNDSSLSTGDI